MSALRKPVTRPKRTPVVLQLNYRNAGHLLVSYCTNLSRGGMFVHAREPQDPGTSVLVNLSVPGYSEQLEVTAEVRWSRYEADASGPPGMGLRFEGIDEILGAAIDDIVVHAQPMEIVLLGTQDLGSRHLAALIETLVKCQVKHLKLRAGVASQLRDADLVIVDLEPAPTDAMALLAELRATPPSPPVLALCNRDKTDLRQQASKHAAAASSTLS